MNTPGQRCAHVNVRRCVGTNLHPAHSLCKDCGVELGAAPEQPPAACEGCGHDAHAPDTCTDVIIVSTSKIPLSSHPCECDKYPWGSASVTGNRSRENPHYSPAATEQAADLIRLREAVKRYGRHDDDCPAANWKLKRDCTCGLADALEGRDAPALTTEAGA